MRPFLAEGGNTAVMEDGRNIRVQKNDSGDIKIVINRPGQPEVQHCYTKSGWDIIKLLYEYQ